MCSFLTKGKLFFSMAFKKRGQCNEFLTNRGTSKKRAERNEKEAGGGGDGGDVTSSGEKGKNANE